MTETGEAPEPRSIAAARFDPRDWALSTLQCRPVRFYGAWAAAAAILALAIVGWAFVMSGGFSPGGGANLEAAAGGAGAAASSPAARTLIGGMEMVHSPLAPAFAPAQALPAPPQGRLFGLPSRQKIAFDRAAAILRSLEGPCGARLASSDAPRPAALAQAQTDLDGAVVGDQKLGLIAYHEGLVNLCRGDTAAARQMFSQAIDAFGAIGSKLSAFVHRDQERLAQYQMAARYGRGLAEMQSGLQAGDKGGEGELSAARTDFAAALNASRYRRSGAFVDLSAAGGDLFDFSSGEISDALVALRLRRGDVAGAGREASEAFGAASEAIDHPSLAANLALAAAASGRSDVVASLYQGLRGALGEAPSQSPWVTQRRDALVRVLSAAATTATPIWRTGDDSWWPGIDAAVNASPVRQAFERRYMTTPMWFPALDAPGSDGRTLDLWLWIRLESDSIAHARFADLAAERAQEAALEPGDRRRIDRVTRQAMAGVGEALLQAASRLAHEHGTAEARPILQALAGGGFPAAIAWRARLVLASGHSASLAVLGLWTLALLMVGLFLVHRELRIGYRRAFPNRHFEHRRDAGGWPEAPAPPSPDPTSSEPAAA